MEGPSLANEVGRRAAARMNGIPGAGWNEMFDIATTAANLGVNPSLRICAMAERAVSLWPSKGEADTRPARGTTYQRLAAVARHAPVVPTHASCALRVPVDLPIPRRRTP